MADPVLPPVPVAPQGTDAQAWRDYIAHVSAYNYAVSIADARDRAMSAEKHAQAQADTAAALLVNAEAQRVTAEALKEPQWTKQGLTLWFLARLPEVTGLTDLARTDLAVKQAEALLARVPQ
jgi:hypothetical protein